jgi:hypothetical protein
MAPSVAEMRRRVAERIEEAEVPGPVFAVVGAGLQARHGLDLAAAELRDRWVRAAAAKDRLVTTALQQQAEAAAALQALPAALRGRAATAPEQARQEVVDLRDGVTAHYDDLVLVGERALSQWRAEQLMNERIDAVKGLTPAAARAAVSARDAARRAAASPTGQAVAQAGRRTAAATRSAWSTAPAGPIQDAPVRL